MPRFKIGMPLTVVEVDDKHVATGDEVGFAQVFYVDAPSAEFAADVFAVRLSDLIARRIDNDERPSEGSFLRTIWDRALSEGLEVTAVDHGWMIRRPRNYADLPAQEQWRLDRALGILDRG